MGAWGNGGSSWCPLTRGCVVRVGDNGILLPLAGLATPTCPLDYVFWVAGSVLVGMLLALPREQRTELPGAAAGVATLLAVSCPVCNKVVVALIGVSGALDVFAPFQPVLGVGALVLMVWSFRRALAASGQCRLPAVEAVR